MPFNKNLLGILGLTLAFVPAAVAQQPQETNPDPTIRQQRMERHRERMKRHGERMGRLKGMQHLGAGRLMRELNISESQREQMRAIHQRRLESTKAQREELFRLREKRIAGTFTAEDEARAKTLRQEIQNSMEGIRAETEAVLTAEQKARREQLKAERKAKQEVLKIKRKGLREQRLKLRQERLNKTPVNNPL